MNHLRSRLSIAFSVVVAVVLILPTLIFIFLLSPLNPWQPNVALILSDIECVTEEIDSQQVSVVIDDECETGNIALSQIANEVLTETAIALATSGIAGLIAGAVVSRQLTEPVTQLTEGVKAIRQQALGHRVETNPKYKGVC